MTDLNQPRYWSGTKTHSTKYCLSVVVKIPQNIEISFLVNSAHSYFKKRQLIKGRAEKVNHSSSGSKSDHDTFFCYLGVVQSSGLRVARKEMKAVTTEKMNHVTRNLHQCSFVVKYRGTTHIWKRVTNLKRKQKMFYHL